MFVNKKIEIFDLILTTSKLQTYTFANDWLFFDLSHNIIKSIVIKVLFCVSKSENDNKIQLALGSYLRCWNIIWNRFYKRLRSWCWTNNDTVLYKAIVVLWILKLLFQCQFKLKSKLIKREKKCKIIEQPSDTQHKIKI